MEAKFTPGPWSRDAIRAALHAAHHHDGSWVDELKDGEYMPDQDDANLIAASPLLYEALEDRCRFNISLGHCRKVQCLTCNAFAALRAARGEK